MAVPPKGLVVPEGHCVDPPVCVKDTLDDRAPLVDAVGSAPEGVLDGDTVPGPWEGVLGVDPEGFPSEREAKGDALPLRGGLGVYDPEGDMDRLKVGDNELTKEGLDWELGLPQLPVPLGDTLGCAGVGVTLALSLTPPTEPVTVGEKVTVGAPVPLTPPLPVPQYDSEAREV